MTYSKTLDFLVGIRISQESIRNKKTKKLLHKQGIKDDVLPQRNIAEGKLMRHPLSKQQRFLT